LSQVAHGLDDYYTGRGEIPGRWLGNASTGLDLDAASPLLTSERSSPG